MIISCQNDSTDSASPTTNAISNRGCASQEVLEAQMIADPTLAIRMNEIEAFTQNTISKSNFRLVRLCLTRYILDSVYFSKLA